MLHRVFRLVVLASVAPALFAQSDLASLEGTSWYAEVTRQIQREEYEFRELAAEPGVWAASNRSQGFRATVSQHGLDVLPRDAREEAWSLRLSTSSFGRVGDVRELGASIVKIGGERHCVELDHGLLCEFFENRDDGLEQSWTIAQRPRGVAPLWIGLSFAGNLALRIDEGARSAVLVDACGEPQLRYRDLLVFDANGHELDARLVPSPTGVGIEIDDTDARYPVIVDPLIGGVGWTAEGNQSFAAFGTSVASAGDVNGDGYSDVIVGANQYDGGQDDEGRAFVYLGSSSGLSTSFAWTAESNVSLSFFGHSVATAGDVNGDGYSDVIVGAHGYSNGQTAEGRAFVFLGSSTGLGTSPAWTAESDQAFAQLGSSVATAGDVNGDGFSDVVVGAWGFSNGQASEGRAYLYLGSSGGLGTSPAWTAESDQANAVFGWSVCTAGDVNGDSFDDVVVGARSYTNGQSGEGRAFLYLGSSIGLAASAAWTAEGDEIDALFGTAASTAGDVNADGYSDVIVCAPQHGANDEGRAFLYLGSSVGLSTSPSWTLLGSAQIGLGCAVATAGDINGDGFSDVVIGRTEASGGATEQGSAILCFGGAAGLTVINLSNNGPEEFGRFGWSVACAGDVNGDGFSDVLVGAPGNDNIPADEGMAYLFYGSASGASETHAWSAEADQATASYSFSVSIAGDVNGDGFSDTIVGAPFYDNGQTDEGRAFAYLGSSSGLSASPSWTAESDQVNANFGRAVATAGDVNGDGFSDVIIGAYRYDDAQMNCGRSFVYLGSSSGLSASPSWTAGGVQLGEEHGITVAAAGDVNGDGFSDVIVGAHFFDNGQVNEGSALVYHGSANGLSASPTWTAEGDQDIAEYGISVASAGDVNRDGFSDVIVGAHLYDNGQTNEGRAYVYLGSANGLSASPSWTKESDQTDANFGLSVASAGDVNGDGFSDVIVGAPRYANGQVDEGRTYVYRGSASGLVVTPAWTAESNQTNARFGVSVSTAGDVNGDGYSDVIVGSERYDNGEVDEGRAFLYLGSASGPTPFTLWTSESNQAGAFYGSSVSTAGDVNGDGFCDVIVGAYDYDNGEVEEGRAFVFYGNEGRGGWTLAPRQRRANDSAPIHLLGSSVTPRLFRLALDFERELAGFQWASGVTPNARLEWEIAPLGEALDASVRDSGSAQTITGVPLAFDELVELSVSGGASLPIGIVHRHPSGAYHWRMRVRTNNPLFPVTPWTTLPWNNATETKLRTGKLPASRVLH